MFNPDKEMLSKQDNIFHPISLNFKNIQFRTSYGLSVLLSMQGDVWTLVRN